MGWTLSAQTSGSNSSGQACGRHGSVSLLRGGSTLARANTAMVGYHFSRACHSTHIRSDNLVLVLLVLVP